MIEIVSMKQDRQVKNEMKMEFRAVSANESFARTAVAAFVTQLNPTLEEISDIKTAVSEAVTNAIIHGYEGEDGEECKVWLSCVIRNDVLEVEIRDTGVGIENVDKAMEPLFTTKPQLDRSGMGFAFMEAFMDDLEVISEVGQGTVVRMQKKVGTTSWIMRED
ncbi:MAG: anti-sigma F factor [Lachnospiraceae bacterium]|nr:anti-sigma F factor [Lachnospiraceae bacterium]